MKHFVPVSVFVASAILWSATTACALDPALTCEASKLKTAGKYGLCRLNEEAKAAKTLSQPAFGKCDDKFSDKWIAAETRAMDQCLPTGDEAAIQAFITKHTDDLAAALAGGTLPDCSGERLAQPLRTGQTLCDQGDQALGACPGSPVGQDGAVMAGAARSYTDNGDGTITDNTTRLMWEKLSDDDTIHDTDNTYTWYTAFTTKIATLNSGSGFADHTDWRLPNVNELQGLADYGRADGIDPTFNTSCLPGCTVLTCSCTRPSQALWTATSSMNQPSAWFVDFGSGGGRLEDGDKSGVLEVRAVRGGL